MKMEGEINLHMIESRIQNIIVLDVVKNKQLAVKTKLFNNKIREHCKYGCLTRNTSSAYHLVWILLRL